MSLNDLALDSRVMITRSLRRSRRDPEAFFTALMLPVVLMLLFVYVFGGAMASKDFGAVMGTAHPHYVDYVVPGLIVLCAGFGAGTTAVTVAQDLTNGIVNRFRSMPVAAPSVLVGHVIASLARNLTATALVIAAALAVGWRPVTSPLRWLAAVGLVVLFVLAISWLAAAIGLLAGGPEAANGATLVLMFLPYVSTAFVPVSTMPSWLQPFARHQPMTPIIETLRALWGGTATSGTTTTAALLWCLGILAVSVVAGTWLFRHRTSH